MRIIYNQHVFTHYRQAIIDRLLNAPEEDYFLAGDTCDPYKSGIRGAAIENNERYFHLSSIVGPCLMLYQRGFGSVLREIRPDCVIFSGCFMFLHVWIYAAILRLQGKRVLFWGHGWTYPATGFKGLVRKVFYRLADGMLLYGNRAKAYGVSYGFSPDRLYVVYNSLDYANQSAIRDAVTEDELLGMRAELFGDTEIPVVICCARLIADRGLDMLLESLKRLKDNGHLLHCLLVGDGPARSSLEEYAAKHQLSVTFYGACYDERVLARFFMLSNVCVSPGVVGLTAIHSLTYGTPVITHDNPNGNGPEWEAICDGETGGLFRQHDPDDLLDKIRLWTKSARVDPETRERCYGVISQHYNSEYQAGIILRAVRGLPALDDDWMQWNDRI